MSRWLSHMKDESDTILALTTFMQRLNVDDSDADFGDSPPHKKPAASTKTDSGAKSKQPPAVGRQTSNQESDSDLDVVMVPQRLVTPKASAKTQSDSALQEEIPLNNLASSASASGSTLTLKSSSASASALSRRTVSEASVEQAIELDENADPNRSSSEREQPAASAPVATTATDAAAAPSSSSAATAGAREVRAGSVDDASNENELDDERNRVRVEDFEFVPEESLADAVFDFSLPQPPSSFRSWTGGAFMGFTLVQYSYSYSYS